MPSQLEVLQVIGEQNWSLLKLLLTEVRVVGHKVGQTSELHTTPPPCPSFNGLYLEGGY